MLNTVLENLESRRLLASAAYSINDLGTLGGGSTEASAINASGQVVGTGSTPDGREHAFIYRNGQMSDQGTFAGSSTNGLDINDGGQIVGTVYDSGYGRGFVSRGDYLESLTSFGGEINRPQSINNGGVVTGVSSLATLSGDDPDSPSVRAYTYAGDRLKRLGAESEGNATVAYINNLGHVVVVYTSGDGYDDNSHSVLYAGSTSRAIVLQDDDNLFVSAINDNDVAVGYASASHGSIPQAFVWSNGTGRRLGVLDENDDGGDSYAYGINNNGLIVGTSSTVSGGDHAFIYSNGRMTDLNTQIGSGTGWELTEARDINVNGQIVGTGIINGETRAFLLTPVATSSTNPRRPIILTPADPDDQISEAHRLTLSAERVSIADTLAEGGDVDTYQIDANSSGDRFAIDVEPRGRGAGVDSALFVRNSKGKVFAYNSNGIAGGDIKATDRKSSSVDFTAPAAGRYFLQVSNALNAGYNPLTGAGDTAGSTAPYRLNVTRTASTVNHGAYVTGTVANPGTALLGLSSIPLTLSRVNFNGNTATDSIGRGSTWIVIHGRANAATEGNSERPMSWPRLMAASLAKTPNVGQALVLDWSEGAKDNYLGLEGGQWILPAARWLANAINLQGISASNVYLAGHSWGSLIAYETAKVLGKVAAIVGMDPAASALGGYESQPPVDFSSVSTHSWGFFGGGIYGSILKARTAQELFVTSYSPTTLVLPGEAHIAPRTQFQAIVDRQSGGLGDLFNVQMLMGNVPYVAKWKNDSFLFGGIFGIEGNIRMGDNPNVEPRYDYIAKFTYVPLLKTLLYTAQLSG